MKKKLKLLPCPFCGSSDLTTGLEYFYVRCNECFCRSGMRDTKKLARKAWNKRTDINTPSPFGVRTFKV